MTKIYETNDTFYNNNLFDGNINEMCQDKFGCKIFHALFVGSPMNSSGYSLDSFDIENVLDPFDSIWLKLLTILVYTVEIIASIVMLAFVAYETQGLAGHFRTLINHLLSYLYGGVSFAMWGVLFPMGLFNSKHENSKDMEIPGPSLPSWVSSKCGFFQRVRSIFDISKKSAKSVPWPFLV